MAVPFNVQITKPFPFSLDMADNYNHLFWEALI